MAAQACPGREERFAVIGDIVNELVDRPDPLVVDLGVGPGSLAKRLLDRLLDRLPGGKVVGVDADPLLLGLAEIAYGGEPTRGSPKPDWRGRSVTTGSS